MIDDIENINQNQEINVFFIKISIDLLMNYQNA